MEKQFIIITILRERKPTRRSVDKIFLNTVQETSVEDVRENIYEKYEKSMIDFCHKKYPSRYIAQISTYPFENIPTVLSNEVLYIPQNPNESTTDTFEIRNTPQ